MKKSYLYLLSLVLINICIYHRWISFSVFTYSDWIFYFKNSLADQLIPSVWNPFGFGAVDIILWKLPIYLLTGMFGRLGFDYNVAEKFIVFWPIVFGLSISSYLLVRHVTKSDVGAFVGALAFSFNTYFLSIDSQGHQFLPAAFVFATLAILFYIKLIEYNKFYLAIITGILLLISGVYDLRSLYITLGVLFLYFLYDLFLNFQQRQKYIVRYIIYAVAPLLLYVLLSAYWVLPILFTGSLNDTSVLGRQLFGNDFYSLQSSLTTFFPFWTGRETDWFAIHEIPLFFWLYPILAIWGLMVAMKNKNIHFFAAIALAGIFLSKQADIPFPQIYSWFYTHIPGFSAFREASKFDFLIALGFAVLIGSFTKWVMEKLISRNFKKYSILIVLSIIFLWNGIPILTGSIRQLYVPHKVPREFVDLNNFIVTQPSYFRTFWINMSTHWATFDTRHPEIDGALVFDNAWQEYKPAGYDNSKDSTGKKLIKSLQSEKARRLLDISSFKYVIIPLYDHETNNDVVAGFGESYEFYRKSLASMPFLSKAIHISDNLLIYQTEKFHPHIYRTSNNESLFEDVPYQKVDYVSVNPSEYHVTFKNVKGSLILNFSENYNPNWKIKVGQVNWINSIFSKNYFINDNSHTKNAANFNSYLINPKSICTHTECQKNSDGSYNFVLTLYFNSQSYLYFGIFCSSTVLIVVLVYLFLYGAKKINKK